MTVRAVLIAAALALPAGAEPPARLAAECAEPWQVEVVLGEDLHQERVMSLAAHDGGELQLWAGEFTGWTLLRARFGRLCMVAWGDEWPGGLIALLGGGDTQ